MKKLALSFIALIMAGCASTELSTQDVTYDSTTQSRIRLYGQNGRPTIMTVEINGKTEEVNVGGGVGQAFASLAGVKGNESIGMPETEFSKNPGQFSTIGSKAFFKEFIVPANSKIMVRNTIQTPPHIKSISTDGTQTYVIYNCSGNEITLSTKAGKDYEVLPSASTAECGVTISEIN